MYSCLYYNINVAPSVTTQGRSLISSASLQFEMFLADNVKWSSLNDIITFIDNVVNEKNERVYDDRLILDRDIDRYECFYKIMVNCGFNYIPSEDDLDIVWSIICNLDQWDINRLYYKNNLYSFMDLPVMTNMMKNLLVKLEVPFLDPNKPNPEIKEDLDEFTNIIMEYVYYHHQIIDRMDRYSNMYRQVAVITDTDSSMVHLDPWYRYNIEKIKDLDMNIKHERINIVDYLETDEFGDLKKNIEIVERIPDNISYNFYDDQIIQEQKMIDIMEIIPQEGVRYSIINIIAYILGKVINDYMERYTKASHSWSPDRKCLIIMKNEFLFKRVLLMTNAKKNYATIQELQEGNKVPSEEGLDIKGLPLNKSGTNETTQNRLKKILYEDILNAENVDQVKVLKDLAVFEKEIYESLRTGQKTFYKPARINSASSYEDPMRIQGVKGAVVWNELRQELESIDLESRNSIDILKVNINKKNVDSIEDPYIKDKCKEMLNSPSFKTGINAISVPRDVEIPKWLVPYIDYTTIINDNISVFPLDPIGLHKMNLNNNYTNILRL